MRPDVNASDMGPSWSSPPLGPPLLGRVRAPSRSPTSPLLRSPPTPSSPSAAPPVVPCRRPASARVPGSVPGTAGRAGTRPTRRVGVWSPGLRGPGSIRGETRASQVPGPSSSCVPWSNTPPGAAAPCPFAERPLKPSGSSTPSAPGMAFSWLHPHGPHARVPTLRRWRYRRRRQARYRPERAHPGQAGFAPAGRHTRFRQVIASLTPPRPALPGRTEDRLQDQQGSSLHHAVPNGRDGGFILKLPAARFGFSSGGGANLPSVRGRSWRLPTKTARTNVRRGRGEPPTGRGQSSNTLHWH
jgi:hypothetical protein